jgi:hypothetical protein
MIRFSNMKSLAMMLIVLASMAAGSFAEPAKEVATTQPTADDGTPYLLSPDQLAAGAHHTRHAELFSRSVDGINLLVLKGIDRAQSTATDGGGYFIGVKAQPPESPIGYPLALFGKPLLVPARGTSYCSGSSYTAFIETLNLLYPDRASKLSPDRYESLRMQERDGGRREDGVKFWGHWNDDGPGCQYALVQYSGMGVEIDPKHARPGDFLNINWKSGLGHSTVFLGWRIDDAGKKSILYWASQKGTNGLGDQMSAVDKIASVKFVRIVSPERLFTFEPATTVNRKVKTDAIEW